MFIPFIANRRETGCPYYLWVALAVSICVALTILTGDSDGVATPNARLQSSEWAQILRFDKNRCNDVTCQKSNLRNFTYKVVNTGAFVHDAKGVYFSSLISTHVREIAPENDLSCS